MKLLICTEDTVYSKRLSAFLEREHGDKIETVVFGDWQQTVDYMEQYSADVVLAGEEYEAAALAVSSQWSCAFGILRSQNYAENGEEETDIAKYQRADRIFQEILELYAKKGKVKKVKYNEKSHEGDLYVFISSCGGSGTSTIARAYARSCARYEKVLYLDMNLLKEEDGEEKHGMDAVLMALKSRRDILHVKLMSAVSAADDKVYSYGDCSNPLDWYEISEEDIRRLIAGIEDAEEYQKIVVDAGASMTGNTLELLRLAQRIICIREDTETDSKKFRKLCGLLEALEKKEGISLMRKLFVFRNKAAKAAADEEMRRGRTEYGAGIAGWAPKLSYENREELIDRIAWSDAFDRMENGHEEG